MSNAARSAVLSMRVSADTRTRFAALAARHRLSESTLLARLVEEVLKANSPVGRELPEQRSVQGSVSARVTDDRITLRLRTGDRTLAAERASVRGMKTGSYLSLLIHNHVRGSAVLPPKELDQIKATCAHLAALGRQLRLFGMPNTLVAPSASELRDATALARREIEAAREATAAVVRRNLISWEASCGTGNETLHA